MSQGCDLSILEELTSNAKQIQDDVLTKILKSNANTEYLSRFLEGSSDKELFKKTYQCSGTSNGNQKTYPANNIYFENQLFGYALSSVVISKYADGYKQGKVMIFTFTHRISKTPCGLPMAPALTSFIKSKYYSSVVKNCTSPYEIVLCPDPKQSRYCQLLCDLVQRDEVIGVGATFPSVLVRVINFLEKYWKELASNIRSGTVSKWITDLSCRDSVSTILGEPNAELADLIEHECSGHKSWQGLHRCRVWEMFYRSLGFTITHHNSDSYVKNTVLCVDVEPTTEEDISKALARATDVLESSDLILTGFTCYGDISTVPGHYVFYVELKAKVNNGTNVLQFDNKVLVDYCCVMEESLSSLYRRLRVKDGPIGPLEVRVVQQGTFDALMEFFVARGSSISQYKTPMCINFAEALKVLEDKVLARFFSDKSPPI
ncbi:hypothetical protein F2Q70_00041896 [Brassica cretica]|uniref:GH3 C-terminal domain-containing protein n=1 Tax=Brassica cretica TaxID=69181 RepID=A0A8S9K4Y1_BRACR|nr:hypothetical protein F2Q70_00041896 [Brassica cretica]